jgi:type I site-specific restriction-modification system R (restriction) subunit
LKGKASWFLPFNQGWNSGAGNPPNPDGLKTDYLWKQVLAKESLANIIESYAQVVEDEEEATPAARNARSASRCSRAFTSCAQCVPCCAAPTPTVWASVI